MQDFLWWLEGIDRAVQLFIYDGLYTPVLRSFFEFFTNSRNWRIPLALGWLSLIIFGGKKGRQCALLMLPLFILSDMVTAKVFKPFFGRWRPFGGFGYAFPSVHAANSFAIVTLITRFYPDPRLKWTFYSIATLVAFSRIYVGVHYPADVIAGALWGYAAALIIYTLFRLGERTWTNVARGLGDPATKA